LAVGTLKTITDASWDAIERAAGAVQRLTAVLSPNQLKRISGILIGCNAICRSRAAAFSAAIARWGRNRRHACEPVGKKAGARRINDTVLSRAGRYVINQS
jgi:hypothetical protein